MSALIGIAAISGLLALIASSYSMNSVRFTPSALTIDHSRISSSAGPRAESKSGSGELLLTIGGIPDTDASISAKAAAETFDAPVSVRSSAAPIQESKSGGDVASISSSAITSTSGVSNVDSAISAKAATQIFDAPVR